jgi:hypothetical protein
LTVSPQLAAWQAPPVHTPSTQLALLAPHIFPAAHFVGHDPPQFRSVSLPFLTASLHEGTAQSPATQTPLAQSVPVPQPLPLAQSLPGAHDPPQSISVSEPFITASVQTGAAHK